jgi:hypothetical protein
MELSGLIFNPNLLKFCFTSPIISANQFENIWFFAWPKKNSKKGQLSATSKLLLRSVKQTLTALNSFEEPK